MVEENESVDDKIIDIFVPVWVQVRTSGWEKIKGEITKDSEFVRGREAIELAHFSENTTLQKVIVRLLREDEAVVSLRRTIYRIFAQNKRVFDDFFNRRLTDGNEECPDWNRYSSKPKTLTVRDDKISARKKPLYLRLFS